MLENRDFSSLLIIFFILMTCMFNKVVLLEGEIRWLSLLGFKGLKDDVQVQICLTIGLLAYLGFL